MRDTSTDSVQPAGAAPVGGGGPLVGPYVAAAKNLTLTFAGSGGGTIAFSSFVPAGAPAACTATCTRALDNNQRGTMTVTPSPGSTFAGWSGTWDPSKNGTTTCAGTTTPCTLFMGDTGGADQNLTATFTVAPSCTAATVATQPTSQSITYGANPSFSATASGSPAPTVQWQVSTNSGSTWTNLPGATSSPLNLTKPGVALSGNQYRAVFTNTCSGTQTATTKRGSPERQSQESDHRGVQAPRTRRTTAAPTPL